MPSTETLPNPLTEYQQGYADAMTEAARIINTLYARRFHDPFAKLKDIDLLMLARQREGQTPLAAKHPQTG